MLKLATVFSGIGAIESALKYMKIKYDVVFACDNGERKLKIDYDKINKIVKDKNDNETQKIINSLYDETGEKNYVKDTYLKNYKIDVKNWYEDIKFLNGKKYKNKVDLLVGGSPCQSFSVNGKRAGLEDIRGTLFYDYIRIINQVKPKVFIYENVRGMLNHNKGKTWKTIKEIFSQIDYKIYIKNENGKEAPILNAADYGIPQKRERLFVIGIKNKTKHKEFKFPQKKELVLTVNDFFEKNIDPKYYLNKKGFEFVTTHPSRARVNSEIMGCQKANQQFNWNGDFIFEAYDSINNRKEVLKKAYVGIWNGKKGVCRKYTPRECLRLMGFKDDFKIIHKDEIMYRQAGNSIVVNVLIELMKSIFETGAIRK